MAERDLLICGTCSSQFCELKAFIEHKESCGHTTTTTTTLVNNPTALAPQQITNVGSQQIVIPPQGHGSIVGFPIGMPHVILQTTSGAPQIYRVVLEPSSNSQSQVQTSQSSLILTSSSNHSSPTSVIDKPLMRDAHRLSKVGFEEKCVTNEEQPFNLNETATVVRVTSENPVESSWSPERCSERSQTLSPLSTNDSSAKMILDQSTPSSNLHTETEVATFLATQFVSQNPLTHTAKGKESVSVGKQNENSDECIRSQPTICLDPAYSKEKDSVKVEKLSCKPSQTPLHKKLLGKNVDVTKQKDQRCEKESGKKKACSFDNCDFVTMHKKDLTRHVRKHTGEKPFHCSICGLRLSRQDKLKVHQRIHSNERPYVCTEPGCTYRGNEKAHLKKHLRIHTDERPFRCQFCPYGARDGSHLTVHLRSHTGDAPFHCQVEGCAATFKTSSDLKRHEMLHTGQKPFKCRECSYTSALKANLTVHIQNNHRKMEKYACKSCSFVCVTKKQLKDHERCHAQMLESSVSYEKEGKAAPPHEYEKRTSSSSSDSSTKKATLSKGRRRPRPFCLENFKCDLCGSGFVREDSFRSHIRQHARRNEEKSGAEDMRVLQAETEVATTKSLYPLNYILQSNNGAILRECLSPLKETQTPTGKEGNEPAAAPDPSHSHEPNLESAEGTGTETFPTCMIAVYPGGGTVSKEHHSLVPDSLVHGHDSVVNILSSSDSSSHVPSTKESGLSQDGAEHCRTIKQHHVI